MSDTRAEVKTTSVSKEALAVLMSTGTNRQGARVYCPDPALWMELKAAGLIGEGGGLTRAGSIKRQRHADRLMDDVFGVAL